MTNQTTGVGERAVDVPQQAEAFHRLHAGGLLLLPNAWDAGTARLIESVGARAIATTSAAVCWAHGYPDGADLLPIERLVSTVRGITRVVRVPVTVDIEGGYSDDPAQVGENVARVIDAGGVGINLEDGAGTPDQLAAKIEQARQAGVRLGVNLFVNARADVFLRGIGPADRRVEESIARGERYRAAGADGLFVPGVTEAADIKAIVGAVALPLNVMARPGLADAETLKSLGVRRLSAGPGLALGAFSQVAALASAFLQSGTYDSASEHAKALSYPEINGLMRAD